MIALAAIGRCLHLAQQRVHLSLRQAAAGAHAGMTGKGAANAVDALFERQRVIPFGQFLGEVANEGGEVEPARMWDIFAGEYLEPGPFQLVSYTSASEGGTERVDCTVRAYGTQYELTGIGNGPIAAFCAAVSEVDLGLGGVSVRVLDYAEHALTSGRDAEAAAYLEIEVGDQVLWGVGVSSSIVRASVTGVISALNRAARAQAQQ